jgi:hypothetical protein
MKTLKISGKEYPCRATMGSALRYKRVTGKEVAELSGDDLSALIIYIWCCVVSACNADKISFEMSLEDFADAMDLDSLNDIFLDMTEESKKKA